jgi:integrase
MTDKRVILTERFVQSLKPAPARKRVYHWDAKVDGFGVQVTDTGAKSYILYRRIGGVPTRRRVGRVGETSLSDARATAADWAGQIVRGRDPKEEEKKARAAERQRRAVTLAAVAEEWFATIRSQAKGAEKERDVRREFLTTLGDKPITDVTTLDVRAVVVAKVAQGHPTQARNLLGYAKLLFSWAVDQHVYGLTESPADKLKAKALCGPKRSRERTLTDDELRAYWRAAGMLGYPLGDFFRMLAYSGQRLNEVAGATWSEFDLDKRTWTIPGARMKMRATQLIPLSDDMLALLRSLPRFRRGDHVFSYKFGATPINGWGSAKNRMDKIMREQLGEKYEEWTNHDVRRTMRTHLSALPITDEVREAMIAHAKKGMHKVYDLYKYEDEKRRGFELWSARLRGIVEPAPDNVVTLRAAV